MEQGEQVDATGGLRGSKGERCEGGTRTRAGWRAISSASYAERQSPAWVGGIQ